jgi:hypothetical protein
MEITKAWTTEKIITEHVLPLCLVMPFYHNNRVNSFPGTTIDTEQLYGLLSTLSVVGNPRSSPMLAFKIPWGTPYSCPTKVWVVKNGTVFNDVWTPCYWLQKQFYQWVYVPWTLEGVCEQYFCQLLYWLGHSDHLKPNEAKSHLAKSYFNCFSIAMDWLTKPL